MRLGRSTTTTPCCVPAALNQACVCFLEPVYSVPQASISLWPDSSSVCPAAAASTPISPGVLCVTPVLQDPTTTTPEQLAAAAAPQVPFHRCRAPRRVPCVHLEPFATRLAAPSVRHVLQVKRLCRERPQTALPVDQACTSLLIRPCVKSATVAFTKSSGVRRTVTSAPRITTAPVQM